MEITDEKTVNYFADWLRGFLLRCEHKDEDCTVDFLVKHREEIEYVATLHGVVFDVTTGIVQTIDKETPEWLC